MSTSDVPPLDVSSSDVPDEELRGSIRERLTTARLPGPYGMTIVRRGTGRPCNVCGGAITQQSLEREVQRARGSYSLAHDDCYRMWREEWARMQSPPPPA